MSVRRTVAQSSAGLLLLAAFAAGPTAVYAAPGASDSGGGEGSQCSQDSNELYETTISIDAAEVTAGQQVTLSIRCYPGPDRGPAMVEVVGPDGTDVHIFDDVDAPPGGEGSFPYLVPEDAEPGTYSFVVHVEGVSNNASFKVVEEDNSSGGENGETSPTPEPDEDEPDNGSGEGDGSEEPGDHEHGNEDQDSSDDGQNLGDDSQDQGEDEVVADDGSDTGDDTGTGGSDSNDEQKQDTGNSNGSGTTEDSEEEQQGGDTTASGSPTKPFPGNEESGETSASAAKDNAASRGNASAQPPAAPGSATNDFPAAQQGATADQKQSAALAVLMTNLFAGGVSSGSVGTTPEQARTVIDPSADASEIEVPAGSDNGGSSDDGSGSESSDGDALAATGSNMLVPAGIAAAAILLGAGLKIHQIRRGL